MAKIMIIEDDINIAKGLDEIVKSVERDVEITITGYANKALEYANTYIYDMFLIDIQLLDYSGLELAKELRDIDEYKLTHIVFITSIPTKEVLAFKEVHCYDYIIKPFKKEEVIKVIETIINYGIKKEKKEEYISFNLRNYIYRVKLDEIIYLESSYRKIKVVTTKEEINLPNYTLNKLLDELPNNFIRCHRSYIVNANHISRIDKVDNSIELAHIDISIPVGRKYKDNLRGVLDGFY